MIRRLVYSINMIVLYTTPYIQVVLNSSMSLSILLYQIIHRPYSAKKMNLISTFLEFNIFLILSLLGSLLIPGKSETLCDLIDWTMVAILYSSISIPTFINVLTTIKNFITKSKLNDIPEVKTTLEIPNA